MVESLEFTAKTSKVIWLGHPTTAKTTPPPGDLGETAGLFYRCDASFTSTLINFSRVRSSIIMY